MKSEQIARAVLEQWIKSGADDMLVADGYSIKQIARIAGCSVSTVRRHVKCQKDAAPGLLGQPVPKPPGVGGPPAWCFRPTPDSVLRASKPSETVNARLLRKAASFCTAYAHGLGLRPGFAESQRLQQTAAAARRCSNQLIQASKEL